MTEYNIPFFGLWRKRKGQSPSVEISFIEWITEHKKDQYKVNTLY